MPIKAKHIKLGSSKVLVGNSSGGATESAYRSTGFIPLSIADAREMSSNDYINTAGDAGVLSKNTSPLIESINGATDKGSRLVWAATNVDAIKWTFAYPPDLDDTAAITVNFMANMAGATDTPTITVGYFEGVGDTNAGGTTAALSTTVDQKSVTIAAADVGAYPNFASIEVLPGTHGTDAVRMYSAWIEYTRKVS